MISRIALAPFAAAALLGLAFPAAAGSPGSSSAGPANEGPLCADHGEDVVCIELLIDHLERIALPENISTMLIGNPAIADVNLISDRVAVASARSVGSTNMLFLDFDGDVVGQYILIVREPELRRVVLRRGPALAAHYQCAPNCERTLSQNDSPGSFSSQLGVVRSDNGLADAAASAGGRDQSAFEGAEVEEEPEAADTDGAPAQPESNHSN